MISNEKVTCQELAEIQESYEIEISDVVKKAGEHSGQKFDLIANHGQTVFHRPPTHKKGTD